LWRLPQVKAEKVNGATDNRENHKEWTDFDCIFRGQTAEIGFSSSCLS
jgi:hypothetical protein